MHKLRAYLVPPVSGEYRFHAVGQGKVRLSLSPDESVLRQRQLIEGGDASTGDPIEVNNPSVFSDSGPVHLNAGSRHFMEVIFYQERAPSGFKLEWLRPDGVREGVPATALQSFAYAEDDRNHDDLPDDWQSWHKLDVSGNHPEHFAAGDADHDGLTNGEEFLAGTDPLSEDTDQDGVPDRVEVNVLGTSPVDGKPPTEAAPQMDLFAARPLTYSWSRAEAKSYEAWNNLPEPLPDPAQPSLVCSTGCGSAEYDLTVGKAGIHLFTFHYQVTHSEDMEIPTDIEWWIDNQRLPDTHNFSHTMCLGRVSFLTPWLGKGKHTLRFKLRERLLHGVTRVFKVGLERVRDGEFTERVKQKLAEANWFSSGMGCSPTSPASVEFTSRIWQTTPLKSGEKNLPVSLIGLATSHAEVELPGDGSPRPLSAKVENGALTITGEVRWTVTNVFAQSSLEIRQGDSLRLAATPEGSPAEDMGTLVVQNKEYPASLKRPLIHRFETAGSQEILGRFSKDGKMVESRLSLRIIPRGTTLDAGWARVEWTACKMHALDAGLEIDGLGVVAVTTTPDGNLALSPRLPGDFLLPVRLGCHGAMTGLVKVRSCGLFGTNTYFPEHKLHLSNGNESTVFSKTTWDLGAIVENPPPDARIRFVCLNKSWRPMPFDGKADSYLPTSSVNEEDMAHFYATSPSGSTGGFYHHIKMVMPDGTEL